MGRHRFWEKVGSVATIAATLHFFHSLAEPYGFVSGKSEPAPAELSRAALIPQQARLVRIPEDTAEQPEIEAAQESASVGVGASLVLVGFAAALWFATRRRLRLQPLEERRFQLRAIRSV